ncbi:hypothetical protein HaloA020_28750 [Halomonas sp. A020]|nr:hypothetical protein HaloA020_28750 [Halomonas sp. A020]
MTTEFKREHGRYYVIKDKDLTLGQRFALIHILKNQSIPTRESVVIESDWPIYEAAWEMVRRLAEGLAQEVDELRANADEMKRLKTELRNALGCDAPNPSMCDLVVEAQLLTRERDAYRAAEEHQIALRQRLEAERDALAVHVERITTDIHELMDNSEGVAGLHLNGDVAPWGELTAGGAFEGWLMSLDDKPVEGGA